MRHFFRTLKILGLLVGVLAVTMGILLYGAFSGVTPINDGQRWSGVEVVKDGFVSAYIVDIDERSVVLVDTGNDRKAGAILRALGRRGLGADAVKAILLTHGDGDHVAGVLAFPAAQVMALEPDVALAEGRAARGIFKLFGTKPNGIKIARALHDGETVTFDNLAIQVFAVPGHTPGSAAYLARSVLFVGDSSEATKEGKLAPGKRLFTSDPAQNRASLRQLAARLRDSASPIKVIASSHTGALERGLDPLTTLAAQAD